MSREWRWWLYVITLFLIAVTIALVDVALTRT